MKPRPTPVDEPDERAIEPEGLSRREAARYLGVSPSSFDTLVRRHEGVRRARRCPTSRPVYCREILKKWLHDSRTSMGCPTTATAQRRSA